MKDAHILIAEGETYARGNRKVSRLCVRSGSNRIPVPVVSYPDFRTLDLCKFCSFLPSELAGDIH